MKNFIFLFILIIILTSFNNKTNGDCFTHKEISIIKKDIMKIDFFNEYNLKKPTVWENSDENKECNGLFYVCFNSKNNLDHIYVPCLKTNNKILFNTSIYEGRKLLKDTFGISLKLTECVNDLKNNFSKSKIDSIKIDFLYGIYSISNIKS